MSFSGRLNLKMDPKGRFRLPSTFASGVSEKDQREGQIHLVITNSIYKGEKCLDVYTESEWELLTQRMSKLPAFDTHVQAFQRFYLASAHKVVLDAQGRMLTPTVLREFAALSANVVVIGMGSKFEIWDEAAWNKVYGDISQNYDEILQAVSRLSQEKDHE
ncbi:MAG: division/cell wall cluster transcriptional repressor MraZ [Bdellovibrionaceae bacterium]|nr:division/cell wall cluster transcriptional repressor MraZ [Pseudobdellovibrionaceae bacterium]